MTNLELTPRKREQFNQKGIFTYEDLVNYIPRKYYDFSCLYSVDNLYDGYIQAIVGTVLDVQCKDSRSRNSFITIKMADNEGRHFGVTFFGQMYRISEIYIGQQYLVCGQVRVLEQYRYYKTFTNPIVFTADIQNNLRIYPVYSKIKGTSDEFLQKEIKKALSMIDEEDYLEENLVKKYNLLSFAKSKNFIHNPRTTEDIKNASKRLLFDDLFMFNFKVRESTEEKAKGSNITINNDSSITKIEETLPFELTDSQKTVVEDLVKQMKNKTQLNALIQGDVGCGKTLVAILLMAVVCENGGQSCLIAPTEILANQHFEEIKERLGFLNYNIALLTGKLKKKEQNKIKKELENGSIDLVIGTHSLMQEGIKFKNLGIAIIDEEHRFGVEQRNVLKQHGAHIVSMSATPIPRTLAISMFGSNVLVETINGLPKGRQKVDTKVLFNIPENKKMVYEKILEELKKGRQAYIICPLIKDSDSKSKQFSELQSIEQEYYEASQYFEQFNFTVGYAVGDSNKENTSLKTSETLENFSKHKIDVLVATTIIEVGVNVPNATVIAIINAERFGYSQIHQLRGRVGRSSYKSYCYLISDKKDKFKIFEETSDGFEIAKADLKNRGAGALLGVQQSGSNKYLELILAYPQVNKKICEEIDSIFADESRLKKYKEKIGIMNLSEIN